MAAHIPQHVHKTGYLLQLPCATEKRTQHSYRNTFNGQLESRSPLRQWGTGCMIRIYKLEGPFCSPTHSSSSTWKNQLDKTTSEVAVQQWSHVMFSDQFRFILDFNDSRQRVWCHHRECYFDIIATTPHDRYIRGSVTVWSGITMNGQTDLHICQGRVTGVY